MGHEIKVITSHTRGLSRQESLDGYTVIRTPSGRKDLSTATFFSMGGFILGGLIPALRVIRQWNPAVMHVHFAVPTGALAWILALLTGVPYVLTSHLGDVPGGVPEKTDRWFRLVQWFTPSIWRRATHRVAVSDYTRDLATLHYKLPIDVIPNGVKIPSPPSKDPVEVANDTPKIIFAGRFQPQKNLTFLIEALSSVRDLKWKCALVGDGPEREEIEKRIASLNLEDRIELPGWVTSDEVWRRLGESDLLTMPSLSEGLPVVGVHALAQGLAIVANRAGGLTDLVQDGVNGRLCEIGDENCFFSGLRWCLEDQARLGKLQRASRDMADRFDIGAVAISYESIFKAVTV
jgi:glycosyltransferase involved in cell wall biosynthesis